MTGKTVIIADDHAIVRRGTAEILAQIPGLTLIDEVDNGLSAIASVKKHSPDLVVLDAAMPMARGIEVFCEIRRWSPNTKVTLLTGFTSLTLLNDWIQAGVDGVLLKSCEPEEMRLAFEANLRGTNFICRAVSEKLESSAGMKAMTAREREVLSLIAGGFNNAQISERLCISPKTVEKHRAGLMAKFGVHSVAELMACALREGVLDDLKQL